jgi:hypothetical protein
LTDRFAAEIDERGFGALRSAVPSVQCDELLDQLPVAAPGTARGGARLHLDDAPLLRSVATEPGLQGLASTILGRSAFPVRALYFDKTRDVNWKVAWHQDLTIAVRERVDAAGFSAWSSKGGVPHVQPPVRVLERMVALRLHLDDCGDSNGPLRVIPGSHKLGRLSSSDIAAIRARDSEHACVAVRGDVIVLTPLLLHASSPAIEPGHRRVLHIEYACEPLPGGLEWFEPCA